VDVVFRGVLAVAMPTSVEDPVIEEADAATTVAVLSRLFPQHKARWLEKQVVFRIRGRDCEGHIVAEGVWYAEDEGEYYDPSPFDRYIFPTQVPRS
jgi:hypothetical protein